MTGKNVENGETVYRSAIVPAKKIGGPAPRIVGLRHVGMIAENPAALARFYQDVLGLQVVGGSGEDNPFGASAFLTSDPDEDSHQIAIFTDPALRHIAFKVATLADLRAAYRRIVDMGLPIRMALNHGVSLAFYFEDPEGNLVEVYWATGMPLEQPYGDPLDLTLAEEALRQDVERVARQASARDPLAAASLLWRRAAFRLWTVKLMIARDHVLVTHPLFRWIRHPNYFLNILPELVGFALALHAWLTLVIGLAIYAVPLGIRILQEERAMREHVAGY